MSEPAATRRRPEEGLAIVLTGGGARAAYQVGLLSALARHLPDLGFSIITGVSAGAINAAYLASHRGSLAEAAEGLRTLWTSLDAETVFSSDSMSLAANVVRWGLKLVSGGAAGTPRVRSLLDTAPLRTFLRGALPVVDGEVTGIAQNLREGRLRAFALSTLNYATGQTVIWVQGREIEAWERPNRISVPARIGVDHVMASAALPLVFPAVRLGGAWHGDGGIRQAAPLSPAIHLGATRMVAISTRYPRSIEEASRPVIRAYPPPAQILGTLLNAVFLDNIDQDAMRTQRLNRLLLRLPAEEREGLQPVDLVIVRPSQDLGRLAADYEPRLPRAFRFLARGLGSHETRSPDFLSLLMFEPGYLARLIEIGEADAEARLDDLKALLAGEPVPAGG